MRTLYDSTSAVDIPAGSRFVGGYVDGSSAWSASDWDRFPGRTLVRFCIFNDRYSAQVIDIEPGNNDARGAVPWIREKWLRGEIPTVYCFSDAGPDGYRISDVRSECDAAGLKHPYFLIAQWDNDPTTFDPSGDPEIIGKQYANSNLTGGHFDATVVADFWPGVDAAPAGGTMTAQETYDLIAPLLQENIVAKQASTNTAIKNVLMELAAADQHITNAALAEAMTKLAKEIEAAAATVPQ